MFVALKKNQKSSEYFGFKVFGISVKINKDLIKKKLILKSTNNQ